MAFDISSIQQGPTSKPPRIVIYGPHGIGKSTFGSEAPNPIFIQVEDGIDTIDVPRFPLAKTYGDVRSAIETLLTEDHEFKTVVVDSIDWCEALIWKHVAKEHNEASIESFGFGRGYVFAEDVFRSDFLAGLNALRAKGMAIILIAHSQVRRFDDPMSEAYDRFELKLHKRASAVVEEWADVIGFAHERVMIAKEEKGFNKKRSRGISSGNRVLGLEREAAFEAKNRLGLPAEIAFSWDAFAEAMTA